jgi:hypothetical protein
MHRWAAEEGRSESCPADDDNAARRQLNPTDPGRPSGRVQEDPDGAVAPLGFHGQPGRGGLVDEPEGAMAPARSRGRHLCPVCTAERHGHSLRLGLT